MKTEFEKLIDLLKTRQDIDYMYQFLNEYNKSPIPEFTADDGFQIYIFGPRDRTLTVVENKGKLSCAIVMDRSVKEFCLNYTAEDVIAWIERKLGLE